MTQEQLELLQEYVRCEVHRLLAARFDLYKYEQEEGYAKEAFENLVASFSEDQK